MKRVPRFQSLLEQIESLSVSPKTFAACVPGDTQHVRDGRRRRPRHPTRRQRRAPRRRPGRRRPTALRTRPNQGWGRDPLLESLRRGPERRLAHLPVRPHVRQAIRQRRVVTAMRAIEGGALRFARRAGRGVEAHHRLHAHAGRALPSENTWEQGFTSSVRGDSSGWTSAHLRSRSSS